MQDVCFKWATIYVLIKKTINEEKILLRTLSNITTGITNTLSKFVLPTPIFQHNEQLRYFNGNFYIEYLILGLRHNKITFKLLGNYFTLKNSCMDLSERKLKT